MEEFNLSKINIYSIDELVEYILSGSTTKEQLYKNGLFRPNRPLLEKALGVRGEMKRQLKLTKRFQYPKLRMRITKQNYRICYHYL